MPTIPTGKLERELRKLYIRWVENLPKDKGPSHESLRWFQEKSTQLIERMGGDVARLGALGDFPAPRLLDLSPHVGTIYKDMEQAAIQAAIATGLNPNDAARAMMRAGMDKSYRRLNRLARTETVSAYWKNSWDSIADLPELVMVWGAEQGPRTCAWCLERDGLVMESSALRDHPNGRCTPLPTHTAMVEYRGSIRADGVIYQDPAWAKKRKPVIEEVVTPYDESQFGVEWPTVSIGDKTARLGNSDAIERMVDSSLSDSEKEAVRKYASGQYFFDIRDAYKNGTPYLLDDGTDLFTSLYSALEKSSIGSDTKLYRAMQVSQDWLDEVTPGSNILHDFFISTTADNAQAQSYGKQKGKRGQKPVLLEILAPRGTKAVPGMSEIQELVLSPDSVMRVVRKKELSKYTYVVVELR